jgi:hypothetical protein
MKTGTETEMNVLAAEARGDLDAAIGLLAREARGESYGEEMLSLYAASQGLSVEEAFDEELYRLAKLAEAPVPAHVQAFVERVLEDEPSPEERAYWLSRSRRVDREFKAGMGELVAATLTGSGKSGMRCEPTDEGGLRCTAEPEPEPVARASRSLRATGARGDGAAERLAVALADVIEGAVVGATPEPSEAVQVRIDHLHLGDERPPAPPVVNVQPPEVHVRPPEVVVNVEAPKSGPRSVRVEEDEDGTRRYVVEEEG